MKKTTVSGILLALLLTGVLALAFDIQVKAQDGTIYVRADGSVDPPTAPISTTDNITYMFTDNICNSSGIIVQKSDIVVNGKGYLLNSKYEYGRGNYGFGLINVNNVTIKNTNIRDFGYGIIIDHSNDNVILGNNITGSLMDGVWIDSSSLNNSLYGNRVERNSFGISIFSPYNLVYGNWISDNWVGIRLNAPNINLTKNLFNSNNYQLFVEQESSDWRDYIEFIDSSNLIDGKPVYYLVNENDLLITPLTYPDIGYLGLVNCTNITIENLILKNNGQGILFANTNNSRVSHNNIESNQENVLLSSSFNNTFSENNLTDDEFFCALLLFSCNNRFHHNNFIFGHLSLGLYVGFGSQVNTWDNGYPSSGNYWSNYAGVDVKQGPGQDLPGSDGIGDTPYVIDSGNQDNYPLMSPRTPPHLAVLNIAASKTVIGQGYPLSITVTSTNQGSKVETLSVRVYANTTLIGSLDIMLVNGTSIVFWVGWDTSDCSRAYVISANVTPLEGETDLSDNTLVYGIITVSCAGDVNLDYITDGKDFVLVKKAMGSTPASPRWNSGADLNADGSVGVQDYQIVKNHIPSVLP